MPGPWATVVAAKRTIRESLIKGHHDGSHSTDTDDRVTEIADIASLTALVEARKLSAEQIALAYIKQACVAHEKTNCLTEINFENAIRRAQQLDEFQQEHGRLIGPLHGVPISFKDQFNVEGLDSTLGYVGSAFAPAIRNSLLVDTLEQLGAIVIAKTNLPQSIMWCETENPLWGLTTHPVNSGLTPGGSSGGEAALLSLHGSLVGWGTDIGGSIRIPSHMNGLWGLKPTSCRMTYQGVEVSLNGQQHVPSAVGPMARSLSSLTQITKLVINAAHWNVDPQVPPMPWQDAVHQGYARKRLVIGIMLDDGKVKVHPPIERVFKELVSKLEAAGHEIVQWDTALNESCIAIMDEYYTADGGEDIRRAVTEGGEPFLPHVQSLINRAPPISVYQYWQLNKRKVDAQQAYCAMWNSKRSASGRPVDILLTPTMPHTAVPHRSCRWVGYTKLFNFLDYPAVSFPAGKASKQLDGLMENHVPRNELDAWNWQSYDSELMHGLDVGLQVVGRRFEEEKILGAAEQVQRLAQRA